MENSRMIIAIVLSMLVFLAWEFFFSDKLTDKDKEKKVSTVQMEKETQKKEQIQKPYVKEKEVGTAKEVIEEKKELASKEKSARILTVNTPNIQSRFQKRERYLKALF